MVRSCGNDRLRSGASCLTPGLIRPAGSACQPPDGVTTAVDPPVVRLGGQLVDQLVVEDQRHQDGVRRGRAAAPGRSSRRRGRAGPRRGPPPAPGRRRRPPSRSPSAPAAGPTGSSSPNRPGASRPVSTAHAQLAPRGGHHREQHPGAELGERGRAAGRARARSPPARRRRTSAPRPAREQRRASTAAAAAVALRGRPRAAPGAGCRSRSADLAAPASGRGSPRQAS